MMRLEIIEAFRYHYVVGLKRPTFCKPAFAFTYFSHQAHITAVVNILILLTFHDMYCIM